MSQPYDVIIIGAGTAGLSAVRVVRKHTDNFLLVDTGPYGTTCARVGCMPSKALIETANAWAVARSLAASGAGAGAGMVPDVAAVLQDVRDQRDHYVGGVLGQLKALRDRSITGPARFLGPDLIGIDGSRYSARSIIVATGSRPVLPAKWKQLGERVMTSDELFEQQRLPARLAVVGLGPNGLEMAQAAARLGLEVYGFGASEFVGGLTDPVVNQHAVELLGKEFRIHAGTPARLTASPDGAVVETADAQVAVDRVLVAAGREPNLDGLNLEALGLELDANGLPPFDPYTTQVGDLRVFIAGDVDRYAPVLHEAADEGYIAGYNAVRERVTAFRRRTPLRVCFSSPNIARAGMSFERSGEFGPVIGEVDFAGQGRARMTGHDGGYLRVYGQPSTGRVLGAELCAPQGEHLAHLLAWTIQCELTVFDVLELPFYHPTVEEALRTALRAVKRRCCDVPQRPELALCEGLPVDGLD